MLLIGLGSLAMFCSAPLFVTFFLEADTLFIKLPFGYVAVGSVVIVPVIAIKFARLWFSYFCIDKKGITQKILFCRNKDIFIAWEDFVDIEVRNVPLGRGFYNSYIYLCKTMTVEEYFNKLEAFEYVKNTPLFKHSYGIAQDENIFSIVCNEKLLNEILKYVDEDKIKNLRDVMIKEKKF
jgi:hypothetical protein